MATEPVRRPLPQGLWRLPLAVAAWAAAGAAAQTVRVEPRLDLTLTASNNITVVEDAGARKDLALAVSAAVNLRRRGAGMALDAQVGVDGVAYARDTAPARLLPQARVSWDAELVERWMHLRGGLLVQQVASDPLAARAAGTATLNRVTSTRLNLVPELSRLLGPGLDLLARSDLALTHRQGDFADTDDRRDYVAQDHLFRLERSPQPLGWALEASHQATRYAGDDRPALATSALTGRLSWAPSGEWQLGLLAGRERARYSLTDSDHGQWGLRMRWTPTERTVLTAEAQDRFFGRGWDLQFNHRMPTVALGLRWVRRATAQPVSQLLGDAATAAGQLDAMLTTRLPDPAQRAEAVQQLLRQLNLPGALQGGVELYSDVARLEQGADLSALFMGRLTTLQLNASGRRFTELRNPGDPLAPLSGGLANSRQISLQGVLRRRLTPLTQAELALAYSRTQVLGSADAPSVSSVLRLGLSHRLSADTELSGGLLVQRLTARTLAAPAQEVAATFGLSHRF